MYPAKMRVQLICLSFMLSNMVTDLSLKHGQQNENNLTGLNKDSVKNFEKITNRAYEGWREEQMKCCD